MSENICTYHRPFSLPIAGCHRNNVGSNGYKYFNNNDNNNNSRYSCINYTSLPGYVDYYDGIYDATNLTGEGHYYSEGDVNGYDNFRGIVPEMERILLTRVVIAICAFGVIGNIVTLALLVRRRWRYGRKRSAASSDNSVAKVDMLGLISLSVSDLLFCISVLPHAGTEFDKYTFDEPTFTLYFSLVDNAVINTFIMASTWLTVSMTINRYAHLCHPILGLRYFGVRFMIAAITVSALFSLAFNLPRFWLYEIAYADCLDLATGDLFPVYALGPGPMKANKTAEASYQWFYFFFGISIPLCILAYCNCRIIHAVYNSMAVEQRRNRERNLITKVLICIVIFYLLLVSPAEINKFFSSKITISKEHIQSYNFAITMLNTFQAVNFSCNFIPYLVLDKYIRACFMGRCRRRTDSQKAVPLRSRNHYESVSMSTNITMPSTSKTCSCSNNFVHMYNLRTLRKPLE
ncbi:hypothetical protein LSH36_1025g01020 [Paralvinella palmiformis]|uniref:G-protein coupled receptors family 1 profile domain-containing protein n=1 Tax=Paralvinella palmiformis TaxID=53620 RepID=A0AAD9IWD3_9ANNE|nr:hypothetical protein LSH36_1025g01020 [Paralvinella palmiformis]